MIASLALFGMLVPSTQNSAYAKAWEICQQFDSQAMVVMVDGKIVAEQYANGGGPDRYQALASGSKSFVGVVAAAAVQDGLMKFDEKVADTLPDWKLDPLKAKVTLRHLISLSSGLQRATATRREERNADRIGWEAASKLGVTTEPGSTFAYGPNPFNLFGFILEKKLKSETFVGYLERRILKPLGISVSYRGKCEDGNPQLAGGAWMSARDWATFGEWLRLNGVWKGKQLVEKRLLDEIIKPSSANKYYGISWWLGAGSELGLMQGESGLIMPKGFRMAAGAGKQRLYIIPTANMVAVRVGRVAAGARGWDDGEMINALLGKAE